MDAETLDLKGRTAKAHMDKYEQYGEKSKQHGTSTAIICLEVKAVLRPHQYGAWMRKYEINRKTASRLCLEHVNPERAVERRKKGAERDRKRRAGEKSHARETVPAYNPLEPNETPISEPDLPWWEVKRAALRRHLDEATAPEIERLHTFVFGGEDHE